MPVIAGAFVAGFLVSMGMLYHLEQGQSSLQDECVLLYSQWRLFYRFRFPILVGAVVHFVLFRSCLPSLYKRRVVPDFVVR